ncbi:MAG: hypothetical protein GF317_16035 [Candidatus Lokiarchaeota archaeon]|nr:hypothetical protein [Candidatus Lokiarchaeota archaeon]
MTRKMKNTTAHVPTAYIKKLDILVHEEHIYMSRCEAIRVALRSYLLKKAPELGLKSKEYKEKEKRDAIKYNKDTEVLIPDGNGGHTLHKIIKKYS